MTNEEWAKLANRLTAEKEAAFDENVKLRNELNIAKVDRQRAVEGTEWLRSKMEEMAEMHTCRKHDKYISVDQKTVVRVCRACRGADIQRGDAWEVMHPVDRNLPHVHE